MRLLLELSLLIGLQVTLPDAARGAAQGRKIILRRPTALNEQEATTREGALETEGSANAVGANAVASAAQPADPPPAVARPKGWDQCMNFARFLKSKEVTGVEFIRTWKATCEPAVRSGRATERYRLMCNSLGGAVEPFAAQVDYNEEKLCDSVLAVFHDVTAADAQAR